MSPEAAKVLLYFVYGLAFFSMGITALLQSSSTSSFPLQKSILHLGLFGIIHGFTEWIVMALHSGLFPASISTLVVLGTFTNGLSFAFLWVFGAQLLPGSSHVVSKMKKLPWLVFVLWVTPYFIYLVTQGVDNISWYLLEDVFSRYAIGLPGALTVFTALMVQGKSLQRLELIGMSVKIRLLGFFFLTYGIFTGLVVDNKGFFPNTIINKEGFLSLTGIPIEIGRASMAVAITFLVVNIIRIFEWENLRKIQRLTRQQVSIQQRNELGRELHDGIVQHMFVTGLKLEEVISREINVEKQAQLERIKDDLNWSMDQLRTFIDQKPGEIIQVEDLRKNLQSLAEGFENNWDLSVNLVDQIPEFTYGALSQETTTHVYYIIQESMWNAFKHAEASQLTITLSGSMSSFRASIVDNGRGFNPKDTQKENHFGLEYMKERSREINGTLSIQSSHKGTEVTITVPWEGSINE